MNARATALGKGSSVFRGALAALLIGSLGFAACQPPPEQFASDGGAQDEGADTKERRMRGFSWVVDKKLAGMPVLGRSRALEQDIFFLEDAGIDLLVSLTIEPTSGESLKRHGIDLLHLPIKDFSAPTMQQMQEFADTVRERLAQGQSVGVHCTAGLGRSGTMLSVYFVTTGLSASEAIAEVRRLRPGSVETAAQEAAIENFANVFASQISIP